MVFQIPLYVPLLMLLNGGLIKGQSTGNFYPFGVTDTQNGQIDDGSSPAITLKRPFTYFGKPQKNVHVNNNGHITFDEAWNSFTPYQFPGKDGKDIIAPFWTNLDNRVNGVISYQQYTTGSVLTQATQDINQYFPELKFSAKLVVVATWDKVAYYPNSGTETSFQAVLISGGALSFILINYGSIAPTDQNVQAGYESKETDDYFSLPGSFGYNYPSFTNSSNVNVTGRWAFRVDEKIKKCEVNGNINSSDKTQNGKHDCHPQHHATCSASGNHHYTTFDGQIFNFQGTCRYILAKLSDDFLGLPYFEVIAQNKPWNGLPVSVIVGVSVNVSGYLIEVSQGMYGRAEIDGVTTNLPILLDFASISIYSNGPNTFITTDFDLVVTYDGSSLVTITVPGNFAGATCGLCGNFNGDSSDDFRKQSDDLVSSVSEFGADWKVGNDPSCNDGCGNSCPSCSDDDYAKSKCGIIKDTNGPFTFCHASVNPQAYFDDCAYDVCISNNNHDSLCQSIQAYVSACQYAGATVKSWRESTSCNMRCPKNSHYELCGTDCGRTGSEYAVCHKTCTEGCFCDEGFNKSVGICVGKNESGCHYDGSYYEINDHFWTEGCLKKCECFALKQIRCLSTSCKANEDCVVQNGHLGCYNNSSKVQGDFPASYGCQHNGRFRQHGEIFWPGNKCKSLCVCDGKTGSVSCSSSSCNEHETCRVVDGERGCHPQIHATCSASGDPHYTTFDGQRFDFQGTCRYILAELCDDSLGLPYFQVIGQNKAWNGLPVSITIGVSVNISGYLIQVSQSMHGTAEIDGVTTNLPILLDFGSISVYSNGPNTFITTDFGLVVTYDGSSLFTITVPGDFSGATCGLCGNFNGNSSDDFRTQSGALVSSALEFGADWKFDNDTSCTDGCGNSCPSCSDDTKAKPMCDIIKDTNGPFHFCHASVNPQVYFDDCVYDVCISNNDHEALCQSIQAYVSACQYADAKIKSWRESTSCSMDCKVNSHYELCGTDCINGENDVCHKTCTEGCFCNKGFKRTGGNCTREEQSDCLYNGSYFQIGEQFWTERCTQQCKCVAPNDIRCNSASCNPNEECLVQNGQHGCYSQRSSCMVSGNPHYFTFDGDVVHFQGTCSYEISQTCGNIDNSSLQFRVVATNMHSASWTVFFVSVVDVRLKHNGQQTRIKIGENKNVKVDGKKVKSFPHQVGHLAQIYHEQNFVVVNASSELVVYFDGRMTLLVKLGPSFHGLVCGMCGNNNGDPADDKSMPDGTPAPDDTAFGNSWKSSISPKGCGANDQTPDPDCSDIQEYTDLCNIITNTSGPFQQCHVHVNPDPYFTSCVFDLCSHSGKDIYLYTAVKVYKTACTLMEVEIPEWLYGSRRCKYNGDNIPVGTSFWTDNTCSEKCICTKNGLQCSPKPCTFSQLCHPAVYQYTCQKIQRQTCTVASNSHFYTFDHNHYHFEGTCTYILSEACDAELPYYRIEGKNEHRGFSRVSWMGLIRVVVYDTELELVRDYSHAVKVNGVLAATPVSLHNGAIQVYQSGFSIVITTDFGLVVQYNKNSHVYISVPYDYQAATCGLCGDFNHCPDDDFRTPSGILVNSALDYANSWIVKNDTDPTCRSNVCTGQGCAGCTPDLRNLYKNKKHCGILADASGPFAACHSVLSPEAFVDNCIYDLCVGEGHQPVFCQALNVYTVLCQQQGIQLGQWRKPGFCEIKCPANSHFESEGTSCPATCSDPSSPLNCTFPAQESCICDEGYVLSAGECVLQSNCGCTFEGLYYAVGQSVVLDVDCGRKCTCSSGTMTCQYHQCGPKEKCAIHKGIRGCRPKSDATCLVDRLGYHTFDGLTFSYPGACELTLTEVKGSSSLPMFSVTVQKIPQRPKGFTGLLKFEARGAQVSIEMEDSWRTEIDGQVVALPFSVDNDRILIYHSNTMGIIIETSFGVTVTADWPRLIRITVPSTYSGILGGLCGNFNGKKKDEFSNPKGVLLKGPQEFGDSWASGPPSFHCVESVNVGQLGHYEGQFKERCSIMALSDGPFARCHKQMDPKMLIKKCIHYLEETGGASEALCEALQGYALHCQQNGIRVEEWRNMTNCEFHCPANRHYEVCGSSCPASCPSLAFPFHCTQHCQEGCQCDDGLVLSGGECVPPASCGCLHNGHYRHNGEQFWLDKECQSHCVCDGTTGYVSCSPSSCKDDEICRAVDGEYGCHPHLPDSAGDTCKDLRCTEEEWCGEKNGIFGCFCNEKNPRPNPDYYDAKVDCEISFGTMSLSRCQLFEAGFYAQNLHLSDPTCKGKVQDGRVVFHFDNENHICGTNLMANGTHLTYNNVIRGGVRSPSSIIRTKQLDLYFSCTYDLTQTVSMDADVHTIQSVVHKTHPNGKGTYKVKIIPYHDAGFIHPYTGTGNFEVDYQLYVAVLVEGVDNSLIATVMDSCWATPENDENSAERWDLIISRCPNPEDNTVEVIENGVSTTGRFSFKTFAFKEGCSKVFIHCRIHLCLRRSNNCAVNCHSRHPHRPCRSVDIHDSTSVSIGPFIRTSEITGE